MGCIYKITNQINNKIYVGQTVGKAEHRWKKHLYDAHNPSCLIYDIIFYKAIRKYNRNNFTLEVIENTTNDLLNEREIYWIDKINSFMPNGYNMTHGGEGSLCKNVYQYDVNGTLIKIFNSIQEAADEVNINRSVISKACSGWNNKKSGAGYVWSFEPIQVITNIKIKKYKEPIVQLDLNNNIVAEYESSSAAMRALNKTSSSHIAECCRGKRKTAFGYKWQYKNGNKYNELVDKLAQARTKE